MNETDKRILDLEKALRALMEEIESFTDGCGCCSSENARDTASFKAAKELLGDK